MRLRYAPKVPVGWLEQLYRRDALGVRDTDLLAKVGVRLSARCQDVLLVSDSRVVCPECGTEMQVPWIGHPASEVSACPACGWSITAGEYHASFEHQDLLGTNALSDFMDFVDAFPRARSYRERMLLIDRLIHAVHAGGNPVVRNLVEGSPRDVLSRLDALAGLK
jgi:ribosomal protein L37AE/L43A